MMRDTQLCKHKHMCLLDKKTKYFEIKILCFDVLLARVSATNIIFKLYVRKGKLFKFAEVYFVKIRTFTS